MIWVADGDLAGAAFNTGGLGIIGGGSASKEVAEANIDKVREITDKPSGVSTMLLSPFVDDIVDLVIKEGVKVVTTGAGNPGKYMERFHEIDTAAIPVVPSVTLAKRVEKLGIGTVIVEGTEASGHTGKLTTTTLVRQVADAVNIPAIGAGGVGGGRGAAAVLVPDAEAIRVEIRFTVSKGSNAYQNFRGKISKAKDIDTIISASVVRRPVRVVRNKLTTSYVYAEKGFLAGRKAAEDIEVLGVGALHNAVVDGDAVTSSVMAGQIAGLVREEGICEETLKGLYYGAQEVTLKEAKRWSDQ